MTGSTLQEVNAFFYDYATPINGWRLFQTVFVTSLAKVCNVSEDIHKKCIRVLNQIVYGCVHNLPHLEEGFVYLCGIIEKVYNWGVAQASIQHGGIAHPGEIEIFTIKNTSDDFRQVSTETSQKLQDIAWSKFLQRIKSLKKS